MASSAAEQNALAKRLFNVRNNRSELELPSFRKLRSVTNGCDIVFNRRIGPLHSWLNSDNPLFESFHKQIISGRRPEDNHWDRQRISAENSISPIFYDKLSVAALAPSGRGMDYYGEYTVRLKPDMICHRASIFEMNPFYFCEKHSVTAGKDPPLGYRAVWKRRDSIAIAKLAGVLSNDMSFDEIENLIMQKKGSYADCDFIEVHIFGPIHRSCIDSVSGPVPKDAKDILLWDDIKEKLAENGSTVEEWA